MISSWSTVSVVIRVADVTTEPFFQGIDTNSFYPTLKAMIEPNQSPCAAVPCREIQFK
jgi:hypothetical protein